MNQALEVRIAKVVDRRLKDREALDELEGRELHELKAAHDRVLAEVPSALERLRNAVAEVNDALDGSGVHLVLGPVEEPYTIEASFPVTVSPPDQAGRELRFNVSHDGKLIVLLCSAQSRVRLNAVDMKAADKAFYLDTLVTFLESAA